VNGLRFTKTTLTRI
ncbi:hypothetical protein D047_5128B, partial [Vibrio parahaemolyticus VPTS-2010_2]